MVLAQAWQAVETTGDWTLVGCTVASGFEFAGFEFAGFELARSGWEPTDHSQCANGLWPTRRMKRAGLAKGG